MPRPTLIPITLPAEVTLIAIAAGYSHSLALSSAGQVFAWGDNSSGELGVPTPQTCVQNTCSTFPVQILFPNGVMPKAIAAGASNSFALGSDGHLYAWGYDNEGELGTDPTGGQYCTFPGEAAAVCRTTPGLVQLPSGTTVSAVSGSGGHTLAIVTRASG